MSEPVTPDLPTGHARVRMAPATLILGLLTVLGSLVLHPLILCLLLTRLSSCSSQSQSA